jgi:SulP family sulfate permease
MLISPLPAGHPSSLQVPESIILPQLDGVKAPDDMKRISTSAPHSKTSHHSLDLSPTTPPTTPPPSNSGGISTTWRRENFISAFRPSGLSLLLAGEGRTQSSQQDKPTQPTTSAEIESHASIPTVEVSEHPPSVTAQAIQESTDITPPGEREYSTHNDFTETTPLLGSSHPTYTPPADATPEPCGRTGMDTSVSHYIRNVLKPAFIRHVVATAVKSLPSVVLGSLLNILDGVSCESLQILRPSGFDNIADGMIIFPATGVFDDLGGMGVSMFFVTYVHNSCCTQESEQITDFVTPTALSSPS